MLWRGDVAVSQSMDDLVGHRLHQLPPEQALVLDALSQCEPLDLDILLELVSRADLEAAERTNLVRVDRVGGRLLASLAHPIFGELRRAGAGEMYLSKLRGQLAELLGRRRGHRKTIPSAWWCVRNWHSTRISHRTRDCSSMPPSTR